MSDDNIVSLQDKLTGWHQRLLRGGQSKQPKPMLANALIALRGAPEWKGVLAYDEFALVTMAMRPPPWRKDDANQMPQRWSDLEDALTCEWLQHQGICISTKVAAEAAETVAKGARFHPIRDYLYNLQWDGVPRIEQFAASYLGANDTPYHQAVSRCMFIAAVARVMQPGCKADHMPILEGAQDTGKSTAIDLLFNPWFSDDMAELGTKDSAMQVRVAWGIEIAELAAMTRGEIERVKAFITRKVDRFRPSYGRRVIEVPQQSVFVGSTNADAYLKDETGNRRFLPIRCGTIDLEAIKRDRDQLWAEAMVQLNAGAPWWFTTADEVVLARQEQAERYQDDPWQGKIANHVANLSDVSITEILSNAVLLECSKWTQSEQNRIARCLKTLGWERYQKRHDGQREWRYRKARGDR
jgi:predicted P-loop ATPase